MRNSTLADKISGILNAAPTSLDPEEEAVDSTSAQVAFGNNTEEFSEEEEILSKFRKQNIDLLSEVDEKYAGKKASRRSLKEFSDEDSYSEPDQEDLEEESENDDEGEEEEEEESEDEGEVELSSSEETDFKHIKETNTSNQVKKGICVRNQMAVWENLLEVRIQLQKCLLTANKMPTYTKFKEIKQELDPEFSNKASETRNILCNTLDKLLVLQKLLLTQYPETNNLEENITKTAPSDDEEIPSDTEMEKSEEELEEKEEVKLSKKRKLNEYETEIHENHKKYKDYRNDVIKKWHDKTRIILKGGSNSHSVLDQIEYILSNKEKLIKRTQLRRSHYEILGETKKENENIVGEEYNSEIFDDDDFYHQLLRELIEVKSADVTDPIYLGRQWIQLQNMRSKMKRKIDTRATKGRKIRYAVHNKLVNFMAPIDEESWTDEAKNELFGSLFGKN